MRLMALTAFATFLLDQISKYLVVHMLNLKEVQSMEVLPPFLTFQMAWNRGVNFGLLNSHSELAKWLLIGVAVVISVWVAIWVWRENMRRLGHLSAGLLVGGALGNVADRLIYGAVADFLNMSCCGIENPYAFNLADVAIFIGAVGLVLFSGGKKTP